MSASMRAAFLGASLVRGRVSASFVDLVRAARPGDEVRNAGVDGDLAVSALGRLEPVLAWRPDVVVVLVGTNDVLATLSARRARVYRAWKRLREPPTLAGYEHALDAIVGRVHGAGARCVLATLPPLGEDPTSQANQRLLEANEVVRAVARRHDVTLVDVHGAVAALIDERAPHGGRPLPPTDWHLVGAMLRRRVLGWSFARIGAANGYRVLSDGVHVAEDAARVIADLMTAALSAPGAAAGATRAAPAS